MNDIQTALDILDQRGVFDEQTRRYVEGIASSDRLNARGFATNGVPSLTLEDKVPLLLEHNCYRPIGLIERVWLDGTLLRFRASVASGRLAWVPDAWEQVKSARLLGVSVSAINLRSTRGGHLVDWALAEISLCPKGANSDARLERVGEVRNALALLGSANPRRELVYWDARRKAA